MLNSLFDNKFWYIGFTYTEFDGSDFEKCPCVIVRNPFGKRKPRTEKDYRKEYEQAYEEYKDAFNKAIQETD